jgi:cytochrome d ubiquinol oxidase subunit II
MNILNADLFTLPNALALCTLIALNAYVVLGGADFGGGVWDFFASGPRAQRQRELISHAIGPIWEANHVWLIVVVVLLFTCFPPAFAILMTYLHIPLTLMLIGIVLRGSAFAFRSYDVGNDAAQQRWGRVFSIASIITPIVLGMCIGTLSTGALGEIPQNASMYDAFIAPWLQPFPIACGILTLALFAFLAAVYLTMDTNDPELREDFRRRALFSAVAVFIAAFGTLAISHWYAPTIRYTLTATTEAVLIHSATAIAAVVAIWALWTRRLRVARIAAPAQVTFILWGWGIAHYPELIPARITIQDAAAQPITLKLTLLGLAGGSIILLPSLWYLFRVFKGETQPTR